MTATGTNPSPTGRADAGAEAEGGVRGALADSRAVSLSPSRAGDFLQCPLLYRFRVIDKLPEKPSVSATRGTVVHTVLERLFDLPQGGRTFAAAQAMLRPAWDELLGKRPELAALFDDGDGGVDPAELADWLAGAEKLVERYFTLEDPNRLEPARREMYVETQLEGVDGGLTLRGYIDRLDVAPGGDLRVVDYKTGKAPSPQFEDKALFQMKFYALVLWRRHGRLPRRLQLVYLGSGTIVWYDPDEADLLAVERKLRALWEAIRHATRTGEWRPQRTRLCGWCDHQAVCPEFGGTPPPYPLPVVPAQA
ncbi:PD-(D/E)XK nuclease family protein [Yinghuangia sp. ASG 101]|uniref:RecB family exonuclease n=1 Tax=Yinghuangia sp. ASG 101 TaxID=2896848 RepID=UPI001E4F3172|nr:PD-(D/E)XK nuclease family protein [Yinghuangia sp. ASG 101]UGQ10684.1 PD-(D/E)XK nuclease family protein [Yinghuangia sp. ASG 101]